MTYFLMIYDRLGAELIDMIAFEDGRSAISARFERERDLAPEERERIEIVVLAADSEADLRRTHARYFRNAADLVTRMRNQDSESSGVRRPKRREVRERPPQRCA